jgi:hypothetical protein
LPRCCCGLLQVKRRLFACRWFRAAAPLPFGTLCAVVTQRPRPTPKGTSCRVAVLLLQPLKQLGCASGSSHVRRRCFPSLRSAGILIAFISGEASCITRLSRRTPNGVRALHALHSLGAAHIYVIPKAAAEERCAAKNCGEIARSCPPQRPSAVGPAGATRIACVGTAKAGSNRLPN